MNPKQVENRAKKTQEVPAHLVSVLMAAKG
jgi:hypothetical protein